MVSLRLRNFSYLTSLAALTRRTVLQKVRGRNIKPLPLFVNKGFQVLFHSPPGVLFTFPSLYCFTIGRQVVFRLGGWSPRVQSGFLVSRPTLDTAAHFSISPTGFSPSLTGFPKTVRLSKNVTYAVRTPEARRFLVWPLPRSLATTQGITVVFFSCRYLDVSVHGVSLRMTMYSSYGDGGFLRRVSPFGHPRIADCLRLPVAFRCYPRPSSAPGAKAFTLCSYLLDRSRTQSADSRTQMITLRKAIIRLH